MYYCSVNGVRSEQISVADRGLAYGDGIFTTAKVKGGKIAQLSAHLDRLKHGCSRLGFTAPDFTLLQAEILEQAKSFDLAVLKVIISAGVGGRGYLRDQLTPATVIIAFHPFPKHYADWANNGIHLGVSQQRLGQNPLLAGLKHLNRLEQVLLRQELACTRFDDFVVADLSEHLIETSCANIFWLVGDQLYTPDLSLAGVAGIIRAMVLAKFPQTKVVNAALQDLTEADAMFISNSVMGIVPVKRFLQRSLSVEPVRALVAKL